VERVAVGTFEGAFAAGHPGAAGEGGCGGVEAREEDEDGLGGLEEVAAWIQRVVSDE
jgi:hypothetical protein